MPGLTRIGRMRHRVTLTAPTGPPTEDASGQVTPGWEDVATVYASVEPVTGQEPWGARQVQADVTHRVVIRSREDVRADAVRWRVMFRGRVFEVRSALDFAEWGRFLELQCVEQVPA